MDRKQARKQMIEEFDDDLFNIVKADKKPQPQKQIPEGWKENKPTKK